MEIVNIFWFRRDLRLDDNHGLYKALTAGLPVIPIFIFDENILMELEDTADKRLTFIYEALQKIDHKLEKFGSGIDFYYGKPLEIFELLSEKYRIDKVFTNEDYEPYAIKRDVEVQNFLKTQNIGFESFKDQVIFSPTEVLKNDGLPFQVYSPYARRWQELLPAELPQFPSENLKENFLKYQPQKLSLSKIGFEAAGNIYQQPVLSEELLKNYKSKRNFPAANATSRISVHLRFGTVSIRKAVTFARVRSDKFLCEMVWREFFMMLIYHFPHTVSQSFKPKYDAVQWESDAEKFKKWCEGKTGFPLVDAGIRELNATGFMHNRVRMMAASFLIKDLHIDWRWGEAYFAKKLLDYDLAQNIGNWPWVAGSGADGSPYFRVFNPYLQQEKFDKNFEYIKKWIPEFGTNAYPKEMVNHDEERKRAIELYSGALKD